MDSEKFLQVLRFVFTDDGDGKCLCVFNYLKVFRSKFVLNEKNLYNLMEK